MKYLLIFLAFTTVASAQYTIKPSVLAEGTTVTGQFVINRNTQYRWSINCQGAVNATVSLRTTFATTSSGLLPVMTIATNGMTTLTLTITGDSLMNWWLPDDAGSQGSAGDVFKARSGWMGSLVISGTSGSQGTISVADAVVIPSLAAVPASDYLFKSDSTLGYVTMTYFNSHSGPSGGVSSDSLDRNVVRRNPVVIDFTPTLAPPHLKGRVYYDSLTNCLTVYNADSDVSLQLGEEMWVRVYNKTVSTIPNGTVVYVDGAHAQTPTIALADASDPATATVIGVTTEAILPTTYGYVTTRGLVHDLDTRYFGEGSRVYLSADTAGAITLTPPTEFGAHTVPVGTILYSHPTAGILLVSPGSSYGSISDTLVHLMKPHTWTARQNTTAGWDAVGILPSALKDTGNALYAEIAGPDKSAKAGPNRMPQHFGMMSRWNQQNGDGSFLNPYTHRYAHSFSIGMNPNGFFGVNDSLHWGFWDKWEDYYDAGYAWNYGRIWERHREALGTNGATNRYQTEYGRLGDARIVLHEIATDVFAIQNGSGVSPASDDSTAVTVTPPKSTGASWAQGKLNLRKSILEWFPDVNSYRTLSRLVRPDSGGAYANWLHLEDYGGLRMGIGTQTQYTVTQAGQIPYLVVGARQTQMHFDSPNSTASIFANKFNFTGTTTAFVSNLFSIGTPTRNWFVFDTTKADSTFRFGIASPSANFTGSPFRMSADGKKWAIGPTFVSSGTNYYGPSISAGYDGNWPGIVLAPLAGYPVYVNGGNASQVAFAIISGGSVVSTRIRDASVAASSFAQIVSTPSLFTDTLIAPLATIDSLVIGDGADKSKQTTASIVAGSAQTRSNVSIQPKGGGAFLLGPPPDGYKAINLGGGNARGDWAVDLQMHRYYADATAVASGESSNILGGMDNRASGYYSSVLGGAGNRADAYYSVVLGGTGNFAEVYASTTIGGYYNSANALYSVALGKQASAKRYAEVAMSNGAWATDYSAGANKGQSSVLSLTDTTGNAITDTLVFAPTSDSSGLAPRVWTYGNCMKIDSGYAWNFRAEVIARSDVGDVGSWTITGAIKRVGATTSMVGTPTVITQALDTGLAGATVTAVADDTNDALFILNTGVAAKNMRWFATVYISMVAF